MSDRDCFAAKAESYDKGRHRVAIVENIAEAIRSRVALGAGDHVVDFGSGTGLLLERLASAVAKITAVDISSSMNQQLESKRQQLPCELDILQRDLCQQTLGGQYNGLVSSMTLHHIEDVPAIFGRFKQSIVAGGYLAIADLDTEDGSFHQQDTGVFHHGFCRGALIRAAVEAGFEDVEIVDAGIVEKPQGIYSVFLLTARVPHT